MFELSKQLNFLFSVALLICVLLVTKVDNAHAQTSAGQIFQQNKDLAPITPLLPEPSLAPSPLQVKPQPSDANQVRFVVKRFVFVGNNQVQNDELQRVVVDLINKPITFADLQRASDALAEYYREQGWLVRVVLPQQDITEGTVTFNIVEAKLGGIKIDNQSKQVSNARVEQWVYGRIPKDSHLSLKELDHAILTLNDLPDVNVKGTLQSGASAGETLLLVTVTDKPLLNGQLSVDNFGDDNTGRVRTAAQLFVNGPLNIGDQLTVYGMYSEGNRYGRVGYSAPIGTDGFRLGVNASAMGYRVLNQSFQSLFAHGEAYTAGVDASYPILRSRAANITAIANFNQNQFKNWTINGINYEQTYDTHVGQLGLAGNRIDELAGGGISTGSLVMSSGDVGRRSQSIFNQNYGVAGHFTKLRYALSRNQAITGSMSGYVTVSGQVASKNMDSSEQLYLGGPNGVRAYSSGQGAASQGNLASVELRQQLPYETLLTAFYDLGTAQTWKSNNVAINGVDNSYVLQGVGLSLSWLGPYNVNVKATWAARTGGLSQSVTNYLNQNGGLSFNRFWLSASVSF